MSTSNDDSVRSQNAKIAHLTSQLIASSTSSSRLDQDTADEDELFAELEAEIENDDWSSSRTRSQRAAARVQQPLMERMKQMREEMHGKYTELTDEKEVIRTSASEPLCIIHFYHNNFPTLAPKYFNTRFLRVFVEKVPFLVEKLGIKVLPCVVCFIKGVTKDRIIGFEELGNVDSFSTATLELRLLHTGVIQKDSNTVVKHARAVVSSGTRLRQDHRNDDDDDFDL
ncbi:thioredoxin-like protein [Lactarius akahatsu]|uniref:Thioredoxin-like protein n=1 Tax=Lactarius akahatsu TaxID=416441 RepID=A0AAD4LPD4_9AGAM|nr:thioredoxin-like protein [Lactarius akahatsu]